MIQPAEIQDLHDRPSDELRDLVAHIAGILAYRERADGTEAVAIYRRIGDRLEAQKRGGMQ